jgi:hypothetical protein
MTRLPLSRAAAALLRALIGRTGLDRDRILLSEVHSTDWQSLTFTGERHRLLLHVVGPDADAACSRLTDGLEDAEFALRGHIVADIRAEQRQEADDASITIAIEALTIAE